MHRAFRLLLFSIVVAGLLGSATTLLGWGFQGHRAINQHAVQLVSGELGDFYKSNENWIVAFASDADNRKSYSPEESPSHYIDFEYFGDPPYTRIPHNRRDAEKMFERENLPKWGTLPWHATGMVRSLADAMKRGQWERALVISGDLGHFIGDGHQPLHTTVNYDGKDTGNDGIHGRFESSMVGHYLEEYEPATAELLTITDMETAVWSWFIDAHELIPGLLKADDKAQKGLSKKQKATLFDTWKDDAPPMSPKYMKSLYKQTGDMAWQQMDLAALRLASLWQWAWVEAGKPTPPTNI